MSYPKKIKTVCVPLDPDECGSVIHGFVRYPELYQRDYGDKLWDINWSASVSLSDCNRVIQWSLTDDEYHFTKIDAAIGALTKLRQHMVEANAALLEAKKEKKKRNLALKADYKDND